MKFCPQCGTPFDAGARFCAECGYDTTDSENEARGTSPQPAEFSNTPVKPVCPSCGSSVSEGDRFCDSCGSNLPVNPPAVAAAADQPPVEPEKAVELPPVALAEEAPETPESTKTAGRFCSACGAGIEETDAFCPECGSESGTSTPEIPAASGNTPEIPATEKEAATEQASGPIPEPENTVNELKPQQEEKPAPGQFCPDCGAPAAADDIFCQECGSRFDGSTGQAPPPGPEEHKAVPAAKPVDSSVEQGHTTPVANPEVSEARSGKSKGLPVIFLAVISIAVLGAGGWFAWNKFVKTPEIPVADTTLLSSGIVEMTVQDTLITDTARDTTVAEPEITEIPEKVTADVPKEKQTKPKKAASKKQQTEPLKKETEEPDQAQKAKQPVVVLKPVTTKTGRIILSTVNEKEVKSGPLFATKLKLDKAFVITKITTYHYNWGKGAQPGTISLQKKKETFGPWAASGIPGKDGTINGKWVCEPKIRLEAGNYKIQVSDDKTWSYNAQSGQRGFVIVEGYEAE